MGLLIRKAETGGRDPEDFVPKPYLNPKTTDKKSTISGGLIPEYGGTEKEAKKGPKKGV